MPTSRKDRIAFVRLLKDGTSRTPVNALPDPPPFATKAAKHHKLKGPIKTLIWAGDVDGNVLLDITSDMEPEDLINALVTVHDIICRVVARGRFLLGSEDLRGEGLTPPETTSH